MSTELLSLASAAALTFLTLAFPASARAEDAGETVLTEFGVDSPVAWYTVNDGVMGGRSRGGFMVNEGVLVFAGSTNTNGGGFSSIRTRERAFDLSGHEGIRLRLKADGRRYTFRLTSSTTRRGRFAPSWWADFETRKNAGWQTVDVPFERFVPRWRGRILDGLKLELGKVDSLGLMIYDKLDGPFRLEVDWIRLYPKRPAFSMERYRLTRRPLLVFVPRGDDARLARQLAEVHRTRDRFDDRDMILIVVTEGTSPSVGPALTPAEAAALRTRFGVSADSFAVRLVGKDGGVKHVSEDVVDLASIYALIDEMPVRQREMED